MQKVLELYNFDKDSLKNIRYVYTCMLLRESIVPYRLYETVTELQRKLFLRVDVKPNVIFPDGYNNLHISDEDLLIQSNNNYKDIKSRIHPQIVIRTPENYTAQEQLNIIIELSEYLNPFPV